MTALAVTLSVTFVFAIALALPIIMVLALIVLIGVFAVLVVLIPVLVVVTFVSPGKRAGTRISGACQRGQSANKQSHSGYRKRKKAELLKHKFTLRSSVLQSTVAFGRHLLHPKPKFASVNGKRLGEGLLL